MAEAERVRDLAERCPRKLEPAHGAPVSSALSLQFSLREGAIATSVKPSTAARGIKIAAAIALHRTSRRRSADVRRPGAMSETIGVQDEVDVLMEQREQAAAREVGAIDHDHRQLVEMQGETAHLVNLHARRGDDQGGDPESQMGELVATGGEPHRGHLDEVAAGHGSKLFVIVGSGSGSRHV
jgi:hypothetical protein